MITAVEHLIEDVPRELNKLNILSISPGAHSEITRLIITNKINCLPEKIRLHNSHSIFVAEIQPASPFYRLPTKQTSEIKKKIKI